MSEANAMTYGGRAIGFNFNPSGSDVVYKLKAHFAEIIDMIHDMRSQAANEQDGHELAMLCDHAVKEAITAQMCSVKVATWNK